MGSANFYIALVSTNLFVFLTSVLDKWIGKQKTFLVINMTNSLLEYMEEYSGFNFLIGQRMDDSPKTRVTLIWAIKTEQYMYSHLGLQR